MQETVGNLGRSCSTQYGGVDHCGSRRSEERFSVALGGLSIVEPRHQSGILTGGLAGGHSSSNFINVLGSRHAVCALTSS